MADAFCDRFACGDDLIYIMWYLVHILHLITSQITQTGTIELDFPNNS